MLHAAFFLCGLAAQEEGAFFSAPEGCTNAAPRMHEKRTLNPHSPRSTHRWPHETGGGNNYAPADPDEKLGFRAMGVTTPYQFIWFRDTHDTKPYFL
jgi:hypothetical protein